MKEMIKNHPKSTRNSALELLRIICMLLIVAHHYVIHGNIQPPAHDALSAGYVFLQIVSLFGRPACSVFALISAFFWIESSCQKHYRRLVPMIAQMFFYSILILAVLYPLNLISIGGMEAIRSAVPLIWGNWYMVYYCIFALFVPFLNPWIRGLGRSQHQKLLLIALAVWSVIPTLTGNAWNFDNLTFFFVMYLIGSYIRLYVHKKVSYRNSVNLLVALGTAVLMALGVLILDFGGCLLQSDLLIAKAARIGEYHMIWSLLLAISLFLFFSNLQFQSRWINTVAASTMGIYLLHDNRLLKQVIWGVLSPNHLYVSFPYVHIVIKVIAVFVACFAVDWVRKHTVGKWFERWWERRCDGLQERLQK